MDRIVVEDVSLVELKKGLADGAAEDAPAEGKPEVHADMPA